MIVVCAEFRSQILEPAKTLVLVQDPSDGFCIVFAKVPFRVAFRHKFQSGKFVNNGFHGSYIENCLLLWNGNLVASLPVVRNHFLRVHEKERAVREHDPLKSDFFFESF